MPDLIYDPGDKITPDEISRITGYDAEGVRKLLVQSNVDPDTLHVTEEGRIAGFTSNKPWVWTNPKHPDWSPRVRNRGGMYERVLYSRFTHNGLLLRFASQGGIDEQMRYREKYPKDEWYSSPLYYPNVFEDDYLEEY